MYLSQNYYWEKTKQANVARMKLVHKKVKPHKSSLKSILHLVTSLYQEMSWKTSFLNKTQLLTLKIQRKFKLVRSFL